MGACHGGGVNAKGGAAAVRDGEENRPGDFHHEGQSKRRGSEHSAWRLYACVFLVALRRRGCCSLRRPWSSLRSASTITPRLFSRQLTTTHAIIDPIPHDAPAGITRDSRHKRRATGGRRHPHQKKRKFETGRPAAMTKLGGPKRIHLVRSRGGNTKHRALRLDSGNFSWGSEG